jgi:hypothetical protein
MTLMTVEERATRTVKYLMGSWIGGGKKLHFRVLEENGVSVPFEWHWQRKNIRGVVFELDECEAAEAWIRRALLAGYTVFRSFNKSSGWSAGRGLKDWPLPWDWDDERGCWDLDAESVWRRQSEGMKLSRVERANG